MRITKTDKNVEKGTINFIQESSEVFPVQKMLKENNLTRQGRVDTPLQTEEQHVLKPRIESENNTHKRGKGKIGGRELRVMKGEKIKIVKEFEH